MDFQAYQEIPARIEIARKALNDCRICPRDCGVDRNHGEIGLCGLGGAARCFREVLHWGEEAHLNPSHQVYFSGCNLRCEYCTVMEWVEHPRAADELDLDQLVKIIAQRRREGAKTLNLLGGEPAVSLPGILELLGQIDPETKVVWNSNMYYNDPVGPLLKGLVDVYLADYKCGNNNCASSILKADDYVEVVQKTIREAHADAEVIIRHLLMPGHRVCCSEPILNWVAETLPDVRVNLSMNYLPPADAR